MTLVQRDSLDDRLGVGFEALTWDYGDPSHRGAADEAHLYEVRTERPMVYQVRRRGGDRKRFYSVRYRADNHTGWCSCLGFRFKTQDGRGPCRHLWLVRLHLATP